jgi:hypothetical protein
MRWSNRIFHALPTKCKVHNGIAKVASDRNIMYQLCVRSRIGESSSSHTRPT